MTRYVVAIDQGTLSTRCIIFDRTGHIAAASEAEHEQIYPLPGWVEHSPDEIWQRTQAVIQEAISGGIDQSKIAAIGIAGQRETTLLWDRTSGRPLYNAISWQDIRTERICSELDRQLGEDFFRSRTGLPLATYISGPKLRWILDNIPGARETAERGQALFGTMDTFLIWWLTGGPNGGVHITDVTNASRTLLMNLQSLQWDAEILAALDIPRQILPEIRSSSEIYGYASGLLAGVPIAGDLGDQQAATVGHTCFQRGEAKNTYGTGAFLLLNTGESPVASTHGLITTVAYKFGSQPAIYALEGSIAVAGALVQWVRDNLGLISTSAEIETLAASVQDNGGVYIVPAFSGLYAPYWRSDARGIIAGLTRYANKGHIARAVLEATAYRTRDVIEAMEKDAGLKLTTLKVDGGMMYNDLLMQFLADMLRVPVIRPQARETTALGAAYAAGLASGVWENLETLCEHWHADKTWEPSMEEQLRERLYRQWQRAVERSLNWSER